MGCGCRVELTLGKLLRLWFCFLLYSILFFSNLLSYIQNNFSYELARPIMGTIFLVIKTIHIIMVKHRQIDPLQWAGLNVVPPSWSTGSDHYR